MNRWRGRSGPDRRPGRLASAVVGVVALVTPVLVVVAGGSPAGAVTGTFVSPATPALGNTNAGASSQYSISFVPSTPFPSNSSGMITFIAPNGTSFPSSSCGLFGCSGYTISSTAGSPSITGVTLSHTASSATNNEVSIAISVGLLSQPVSGTITVTIPSVGNPTTASNSYVIEEFTSLDTNQAASPTYSINPGPASKILATSGTPQTAAEGTFFQSPLVATVEDAFNNGVSGQSVQFSIAAAAGGATAVFGNGTNSESPQTATGGTATTSIPKANNKPGGPYTVTATLGNLSATFFLNNGAGQVIPGFVSLSPNQAKANNVTYSAPFETVTPLPKGGAVTVTFPAGTALPATSSNYTVKANGASVPVTQVNLNAAGTQATITLGNPDPIGSQSNVAVAVNGVTNPQTAGSYTLTEQTSTDSTPATSPSYVITPGPASKLAVAFGDNQFAKPSGPFTVPLGVLVTDQYGNPVPDTSVTFTLPGSGASATFSTGNPSSQAVRSDASGIATSSVLTANSTAGPYQPTATSTTPGLNPVTFHLSNSSVLTPHAVAIDKSAAGTSATYTVPFDTSSAVPGAGCPGSCILTLVAPNGTVLPATSNKYTVAVNNGHNASVGSVFLTESTGYGSTAASSTPNQANIQLSSSTIGAGDTVTVTVTGVTNPTLAGSSYRIEESTSPDGQPVPSPEYSVVAAAPQTVAVVSGSPQTQVAGSAFNVPLGVKVTDASGNPVTATPVTFTAPASGSSVTFSGPSCVSPFTTCTVATDAQGDASVLATAGTTPGPLQVDVSDGNVPVAHLNLTDAVGHVSNLTVLSGDNQMTQVESPFSSPLVVQATDASQHPVAGVAVVFEAPMFGPSATFESCQSADPANQCTALTDGSGKATAPSVSAGPAAGGPYPVTATSGPAVATLHLTNTVGVPTDVFVDGGDNQQTLVLSQFSDPLEVTITDTSGNPVPGAAVTFATPNSGATATFSPCAGGNPSPNQCVVTTDALGNATSSALTAGADPGTYGVVVSVQGSGVEAFSLTNLQSGYYLVASDGGIFTFGGAPFYGSTGNHHLNRPIVGMAQANGGGYYLVASDGGIFTFGGAPFFGSTGARHLNAPVVAMAVDPQTGGYWLVASDGGIFAFNAPFWGSMGGQRLNAPIIGIAATPQGGYYLVASDGGIFTFGPGTTFYGSTGGQALNAPIVAMATAPGGGYWLVGSDGGIFNFGPGAVFFGSAGDIRLNRPIVGMAVDPASGGYWLVASDGGIFSFGAPFYGSTGGSPLNAPIVGMSASA